MWGKAVIDALPWAPRCWTVRRAHAISQEVLQHWSHLSTLLSSGHVQGVSLGARLADSPLSAITDYAFALLFAIAAPVGIGTGVGLMSSGGISTNGETFLLVQGTFDGICAGILLHIGFCLLIKDLPLDISRFASPHSGSKHPRLRLLALMTALWGGAGLMAAIGK